MLDVVISDAVRALTRILEGRSVVTVKTDTLGKTTIRVETQ